MEPDQVQEFLRRNKIHYESWEVPEAVQQLAQRDLLTDSEKQAVIATYKTPLERLKRQKGYIQNDMVCLCPQTPLIDQLLSKFDREHYHTDDEVRFIVGGRGIFGFDGVQGDRFSVEVVAGDFISVPAHTWHWFTLGQNRSIKAIRLFQDTSGWVPYYRDPTVPNIPFSSQPN
jgi:1,2-dihydroxy-3-keto-5-methylthiopentene dioxygenase